MGGDRDGGRQEVLLPRGAEEHRLGEAGKRENHRSESAGRTHSEIPGGREKGTGR